MGKQGGLNDSFSEKKEPLRATVGVNNAVIANTGAPIQIILRNMFRNVNTPRPDSSLLPIGKRQPLSGSTFILPRFIPICHYYFRS